MKPANNTHSLATDLQKGSMQAFAELFKLYYGSLCFFAERLVADRQVAEDIAVESFIKLWAYRRNFDYQYSIKSFLFISTRNAGLNYLRNNQRQSNRRKKKNAPPQETANEGLGITEKAELEQIRAEILQELFREIDKLPEKRRNIMQLLFQKGLNNQEVAQVMNISEANVRNQSSLAIRQLRALLPAMKHYELLRLLLEIK